MFSRLLGVLDRLTVSGQATTPDPAWRARVEVETNASDGHRSLQLEFPRGEWSLAELHDLARDAAEAGNVLTEETTTVAVRVSFPEDDQAGGVSSTSTSTPIRSAIRSTLLRVRLRSPRSTPPM